MKQRGCTEDGPRLPNLRAHPEATPPSRIHVASSTGATSTTYSSINCAFKHLSLRRTSSVKSPQILAYRAGTPLRIFRPTLPPILFVAMDLPPSRHSAMKDAQVHSGRGRAVRRLVAALSGSYNNLMLWQHSAFETRGF